MERCIQRTVIRQRNVIAAGSYHTVGLRSDGTVMATGDNRFGQCDVSAWTDIVSVSAGHSHTLGLRADGTVVAAGPIYSDYCDVTNWTDIVAIAAGSDFSVGLRADGTVVSTPCTKISPQCTCDEEDFGRHQCDVSHWTDIVAISSHGYHIVGLRADGTVVVTGDNGMKQCDVSGWKDIVSVAAGTYATIGLKADGTVVSTDIYHTAMLSRTPGWTDIVSIAAGYGIAGVRSDGKVVVEWVDDTIKSQVSEWTDIVAVAEGPFHMLGLRSDGTIAVAHKDFAKEQKEFNEIGEGIIKVKVDNGQCNVSDWKDIMLP